MMAPKSYKVLNGTVLGHRAGETFKASLDADVEERLIRRRALEKVSSSGNTKKGKE
jgi:hypothetical protein